MLLQPGIGLGPYEILSALGTGGMGEVWKPRNTRLGRIVAIKQLRREHWARFEQEARAIAALKHPNICTLYDIGPDYTGRHRCWFWRCCSMQFQRSVFAAAR